VCKLKEISDAEIMIITLVENMKYNRRGRTCMTSEFTSSFLLPNTTEAIGISGSELSSAEPNVASHVGERLNIA
jgi:hypothetical protein